MTLSTWAVILTLILITSLYVTAEFAAVSVRRSQLRRLADSGNALARWLLPVVEDTSRLDRYIAVCQIGITLSSLVLGAYGQATLANQLAPLFERWGDVGRTAAQSSAAVAALVGLTVLHVILGELVPKSLALQYPVQAALLTVMPMRWSGIVFSWLTVFLNSSGLLLLRLFGIKYGGHRHIHSPEEIDLLLVESRDGGMLEPDEQRRLHQALQLGVRPAHRLMVPRRHITAIDFSTPMEQILHLVSRSPYTRIPVYQGSIDNIIGVLHARDLVMHYIEHGTVKSIESMLRPIPYLPENATSIHLLAQLREARAHQALILDEFGGTEGLVSLEDVLSEVFEGVGDGQKMRFKPERLSDGRVRLAGAMSPDDAEPWMGVRWQGRDGTISGHVANLLGHVPSVGEQVVIDGVHVEVERVADHMAESLLVTPLREPEDTSG